MKLDPSHFCYLTNTEFRVLTAIELGMRNHQYIPLSLITTTANLRSVGMSGVISSLLKAKLIVHCGKVYDGYKLTFLGLDYLALRALSKRGVIASVGRRIGVGKEADVHLCKDTSDNLVVLKFHRLGRISFRSVKNNRDYMGRRKHASWMYLSQLAAKKEFSYLSSLHQESFPVPEPVDFNRHVIAMRFIDGIPLSQVRELGSPTKVLDKLMNLIVRLVKLGVIHGDFNEFNLMISEDGEELTVIDFPQVISVYHENAQFYFDRDVRSVVDMFRRKFKIEVVEFPRFQDVVETVDKSKAEKLRVDISSLDDEFLNDVLQNLRQEGAEGRGQEPLSNEGDLELEREYYELGQPGSDSEDMVYVEPLGSINQDYEEVGSVPNGDYEFGHCGDDKNYSEGESDCVKSYAERDNVEDVTHSDNLDCYNDNLDSDSGDSQISDEGETPENSQDGDSEESGESEELEEDQSQKKNHIQIWKPHVKRVGNRAYGRRLNSRSKNKAKAESKKDHRQRRAMENINSIKESW